MEKQLMIYSRVAPISKERHKDLHVRTGHDYGFASEVTAIPLLVSEFESASHEYPILFSEADNILTPGALVGLRDGENLFVTSDQGWDASYVPAFIRRYPFVLSHDEDSETFTLCIDEGFSGCDLAGEGDALFDESGESSAFLQQMMDFASEYQREFQATRTFCDMLSSLDVLTEATVKFHLGDGQMQVIKGMLVVDDELLKYLPEIDSQSVADAQRCQNVTQIIRARQRRGNLLSTAGPAQGES